MTLGYISNNLSLGLKLIGAIFNTYLRFEVVELLHPNSFSEWIDQVLLLVNLLKVDVTSIDNLPHKIVAMQNMLHLLACFQFLRLSNGSRAIVVE